VSTDPTALFSSIERHFPVAQHRQETDQEFATTLLLVVLQTRKACGLDLLIGSQTKRWVKTSGNQQGGVHAIQGWESSFLLSRLSKAVQDSPMLLVNVMCTAKVNLSVCGAALFSLRKKDRPTHISLIRLHRPSL